MKLRTGTEIFQENIINEAKNDRILRKKSSDDELNHAILDGVSHQVKRPVTVSGDPVKAFEYRKKNKISCCICGISSGEFLIKDGKIYCSRHKKFMSMNESEKTEELAKC